MDDQRILGRIRTRAILIATVCAAIAFAFGPRAGVSLTIAAAVVIFSLLVLEKLTERLVPPQAKKGPKIAAWLPFLLVTVVGVCVLGAAAFRWRGFDPLAAGVGLSVVVAAVVLEIVSEARG